MYFLGCTWSREFAILREAAAVPRPLMHPMNRHSWPPWKPLWRSTNFRSCGSAGAKRSNGTAFGGSVQSKAWSVGKGKSRCCTPGIGGIPRLAKLTPASAHDNGLQGRTTFQSFNWSSIDPGACVTRCVAVMRGTLGLDRPQAADLQPQTVNQRAIIGVAAPVIVVTLPVPFIRFFNAKKLVA
jgi:hypothetical protein